MRDGVTEGKRRKARCLPTPMDTFTTLQGPFNGCPLLFLKRNNSTRILVLKPQELLYVISSPQERISHKVKRTNQHSAEDD